MKRVSNAAYPRVISNLGALNDEETTRTAIRMIRFMNHYARSITERASIIKFFEADTYVFPRVRAGAAMVDMNTKCQAFPSIGGKLTTKKFMHLMSDHFTVGYANTVGFAHPNTGDTMTSVMIGGLRTVMNGDFEIFPGDLVQFYWYDFSCSLTFAQRLTVHPGASRRTISRRTGAARSTLTSGRGARHAMSTPRRPRAALLVAASVTPMGVRSGIRARIRASGRPITSSRTARRRTR